MRILLAEDEKALAKALVKIFEANKYSIDAVHDGQEALDYLEAGNYDAAVLDIMMPGADGLEVLRQLRKTGIITPVLLLTARAEVDDRVDGLDAGADDYLTKPFAMNELLARIRAMTRRRTQYSADDLDFQDISLHSGTFELSGENSVRLSIKEFELLQTLILNERRPLSTQYLLEHVWKSEPEAEADTVWLYISYLKGKLRSVCSKVSIDGTRGGSYVLKGD